MNKPANGLGIGPRCGWGFWSMAVFVGASIGQCQGQGTLTQITFDGPPDFPVAQVVREYHEAGMSFTNIPDPAGYAGFARVNKWPWADYAYNGTAYIQGSLFDPIEVTSTSGLLFGLFSVDLAEQERVSPDPVTVQFVGYRADGSRATTSFTSDGKIGVPGVSD